MPLAIVRLQGGTRNSCKKTVRPRNSASRCGLAVKEVEREVDGISLHTVSHSFKLVAKLIQ